MDNNNHQSWNILNWNVRGLNSADKCNAIRDKIGESACVVYYIQETKTQSFEPSYIRKISPKYFNKFAFVPSQGASGGLLMGWNSSVFSGEVLYTSKFHITARFTTLTMQNNRS
jgi:exonuclease III